MTSESHGDSDPRFLTLTGTLNTRDLGGLPVAGGGVTRSGVFYRSDVPMKLSDADLARLAGLGLRTVIDLRQPYELERDPTGLSSRADIDLNLDVHNVEIWGLIEASNNEPDDRYDITALYIAALDHAGPGLAQAVRLLAQSEGALLFHCTAGKDRTGLVAALPSWRCRSRRTRFYAWVTASISAMWFHESGRCSLTETPTGTCPNRLPTFLPPISYSR